MFSIPVSKWGGRAIPDSHSRPTNGTPREDDPHLSQVRLQDDCEALLQKMHSQCREKATEQGYTARPEIMRHESGSALS